jgi:NAD(P)-dependent dehydrogenase (short-subunit alcohol dehydrogenase family)
MLKEQKFVLGMITGAAAVLAANRAWRRRYAIEFSGRTIAITGGSRGFGLVLARRFAAEGANVCLLARDQEELRRAKDQVLAAGAATVMTVPCDIRSRGSVEDAIQAILGEYSAIDALINNAGVIQMGPLEHMTTEDFEEAMAAHFWGPLYLTQACVPAMKRRGFGRIVNITSIGGRVAVPHLAPYCASKFALVGFSDSIRTELARYGIRVTTVSPGLMRTGSPINAQMKGRHDSEFAWFAIADALPGLSISAERAAMKVVEACRHGDLELTIGLPAKIATLASALAPGVVAELMSVMARLLPGPTDDRAGDVSKRGREIESRWAPSVLTTFSDRAALANNEA